MNGRTPTDLLNGRALSPTPAGAPAPRKLASWINSFVEYTSVFSSPTIFRKWAAIGIIAGVLEQKCWVVTKGSPLYPNMFICLVGPPGIGKSAILSLAEKFLRAIPDIFVAPSSVSDASLIDALFDAKRSIVRMGETPPHVEFNHLTVIASELGVFLPEYDRLFMNTLTKLYDGEHYEQRRRTAKIHITMPRPQLNFIGGTTPSYLNTFLPEGAWDQGFTSRTVFVYCGTAADTPIFEGFVPSDTHNESVHSALVTDLRSISNLYGKFEWDSGSVEAIIKWNASGLAPVPEQPKLMHYNSRRLAHLIKLCVIACASRGNGKQIFVEDYQIALDWLLEAEATMPDIFANSGIGGDAKAIDDAWYYVYARYKKTNEPVFENALYAFLRDRVASHSIPRVIEVMVRSGMLKIEPVRGFQAYIPAEKRTLR